jgi:hypothetical protein
MFLRQTTVVRAVRCLSAETSLTERQPSRTGASAASDKIVSARRCPWGTHHQPTDA